MLKIFINISSAFRLRGAFTVTTNIFKHKNVINQKYFLFFVSGKKKGKEKKSGKFPPLPPLIN